MRSFNAKRWLTLAMCGLILLWSSAVQAAVPSHWKNTGFSINVDGMTLREVINEFGVTYGVRVAFTAKDDKALKGRLKGESGSDFLDKLAHSYKFRWFVYNGTLHVVPHNDNVSVRLEVGEDAVQDAKSALVGLGLFDSRFGWGELPDEGVVMVSGPREYVNLAREILLPETKKVARGKQIMVFRLKYASATDRIIQTRGQKETIPGIKTILTNLLNQQSSESDGQDKFDVSSSKRSRQPKVGKGSARETGSEPRTAAAKLQEEDEQADSERAKAKKPARENGPRIDADATLNAIIIYDSASKREMYQALITELDVEPQQIEIEALIVDIDRSKLSELGVEWGVRSGNTTTRVNSTTGESQGVDLPLPGATLLISNAARFYTRLKAMEGSGEAHVLAKPTVLTLDNVAAVLDLSQTSYVPLVGERIADLANITAGTMLRVVPRIVREGAQTRVRLEVDIEDGALGDPSLKNTVATRSTISTQAIIDLQQTLMIGGYHAESRSTNRQKVPVLGDAPLFGGLFRSNTESRTDRERLFLITPRLSGTSGHRAPERSKAAGLAHDAALANQSIAEQKPQRTAMQPERSALAATASSEAAAPVSTAPDNATAADTPVRRTSKYTCARPGVGFRLSLR